MWWVKYFGQARSVCSFQPYHLCPHLCIPILPSLQTQTLTPVNWHRAVLHAPRLGRGSYTGSGEHSDQARNNCISLHHHLQMMSDKTRLLLFAVFDENRSWYLEENIRRFCTDAAHVDPQDPQFYASNMMHSECLC